MEGEDVASTPSGESASGEKSGVVSRIARHLRHPRKKACTMSLLHPDESGRVI